MIGDILTGRGALGAIVLLVLIIAACGGQALAHEDEEEQEPKERLFATDPFGLEPGLAIVTMTHDGKGEFVVNLLSAEQEETARPPRPIEFSEGQGGGSDTEIAIALAEEEGPVKVSKAVNIPVGGKHIFEVKADGHWTVDVEQPRPTSAPETTNFSGGDNAATPFFKLSRGVKTITMTSYEGGDFGISLLDSNGNPAEVTMLDLQRGTNDQSRPAAISSTIHLPQEGIYLFDVRADGLWEVEIAEGEQPTDSGTLEISDVFGVPAELIIGGLGAVVLLSTVLTFDPTAAGLRGRVSKRSATKRS